MTMHGSWRDARVLVTGARGFIATHLCRRLVQEGASVHGVSTSTVGPSDARIAWSRVDLSDRGAANALVQTVRPDVVFHLAGHVTGSQDIREVEPTFSTNLATTVHLLTAAAQSGKCRVVLLGSMQEPAGPTEVAPSPYAASKWACRGYAAMFHALYQLDVVIARPFMVYGPGQWDLSKLLPYVIVSFLKGEAPRLSAGGRELDWVFVADVVDGLLRASVAAPADGRLIDLGSGTLVTIHELVARVQTLMGASAEPQFGALADRRLERPLAARVDETRRLTGWVASTPLDDGLKQTIEFYRAQMAAGPMVRG